ncbi:MAG: hypothetical protein ACJ79K_03315 [Gemmatimonadaceae bacterium]
MRRRGGGGGVAEGAGASGTPGGCAPSGWRGAAGARGASGTLGALALVVAMGGCAGRSSEITIAYRGDVAAYRQLVRVKLDTGSRARVVVPAFPSAAQPEPIGSSGTLPLSVMLLSGADTIARYTAPPLALAPDMSYVLSIVVSARAPTETRCTGPWAATPIVPRGADPRDSTATAGSLYVSIFRGDRGAPTANCDQ